MKILFSCRNSQLAVWFLILIKLLVLKCQIQDPQNIQEPFIACTSTKDNEHISFAVNHPTESQEYCRKKCSTVSSGQIFESLDSDRLLYQNITNIKPAMNFDPNDELAQILSQMLAAELDLDIFKWEKSLNKMVLRGNDFNKLSNRTDLEEIYLTETGATNLPENIFEGHTGQFSILSADIFRSQNNLENWDLMGNRLTTLPETIFTNLTKFTYLYLNDNRMTTLPKNIFESETVLFYLCLGQNRTTKLPSNISKSLTNLHRLFLHGNKLTALLANIIEGLHQLVYLNINRNELISLPESIFRTQTKLLNVEELNGNNLTAFPWHNFDGTILAIVRKHQDGIIGFRSMYCADGWEIFQKLDNNLNNKSIIVLTNSDVVIAVITSIFLTIIFIVFSIRILIKK